MRTFLFSHTAPDGAAGFDAEEEEESDASGGVPPAAAETRKDEARRAPRRAGEARARPPTDGAREAILTNRRARE
jgi:hypothetical protein